MEAADPQDRERTATRAARPWRRAAAALGLVLAVVATAGAGQAEQQPPASAAPAAAVSAHAIAAAETGEGAPFDPTVAEAALNRISNRLATTADDKTLQALASEVGAIQSAASRVYAGQAAQLADVQAELRRHPVRRHERAAETEARAKLQQQQSQLAAQAAEIRGVAAHAETVFSSIAERRRAGFSARVLARTPSPLEPDFWTSLASATGSDLERLQWMARRTISVPLSAPEPRGIGGLIIGILIAVTILWPLRRLLDHLGWRRADQLPEGGARHVVAVVWRVLVDVAAPALAAQVVRLGARWGGLLAGPADQLAQALVGAVAWAAMVLALGRALATGREPAERLIRLGESEAARARTSLWVVAVVTAGGFFLQRLNYVVGASVSATIAANCVISLAYAGAAFLILTSFGRDGGERDALAQGAERRRAPAWTLISLALGAAIVGAVGAVLLGYSTLAALIAGQIFWLSLIAAATFLSIRLVDSVFTALFHDRGRANRTFQQLFGLRSSTVAQLGLLLSAGFQLVIVLFAIMLALTPFGESGQRLMTHLRGFGGDLQFGKVTVSPISIAGGIATFMVGAGLAHLARAWVERRYLPVTRWDAGVRNSVATGVSYVGMLIALLSALAVTGVGLAQMALVASALSVGIGFGLQQIVQNFVAGVILLIERPVKVGDWVNVGGVEGDVLDIRVRATDIRNRDGSTVIVPNSSLITTNVENKTGGGRQTRIQLQVTITKAADVSKARDAILEIARARKDVLQTPEPEVYIDALTAGGGATLNAWIYVADPRSGARIRSELYFSLLDLFQQRQIAM
jgi:small-conductance mechanosensitive channel